MGVVTKLFSGGSSKKAAPPPLPPAASQVPQLSDSAVQAAALETRKRALSGGRATTVYNGLKGLANKPATTTGKKELLGT